MFYLFLHFVNESECLICLYGLTVILTSSVSLSRSSNPDPRASAPYCNTNTNSLDTECCGRKMNTVKLRTLYLQVHYVIWGVLVAQEDQENLVNQRLGFPVEREEEEELSSTVHLMMRLHVNSNMNKRHVFQLYLLSFGSSFSGQTWISLRSSHTLDIQTSFS